MNNKKTVAYLTRHTVSNYGSVLQAYATQTAIEKIGCNPVCINYYRSAKRACTHTFAVLQMEQKFAHSYVLYGYSKACLRICRQAF